MDEDRNIIRISDLKAYLEETIAKNEYSDLEYGLYIDIKNHGNLVLKMSQYRSIISILRKEMCSYFNDF